MPSWRSRRAPSCSCRQSSPGCQDQRSDCRSKLRYYERAGLSLPTRDSAGRRVYSELDRDQLRVVTALRAVGVSVEAIRQLVAVKQPGKPRATAERAVRQLSEMDAVLRARQAELAAARQLIRSWRAEIDNWLQHESTS